MKIYTILIGLILLTTTPNISLAGDQWNTIIENKTFTKTLRLVGSEFNNTLVRNIIVENTDGDGIYIKDVKNLRIENVTVRNIKDSGIRLGISGSTESVEIINSVVKNIGKNGINAGQRHKKNIDHKNLRIVGNTVRNACLRGSKGLHHALYIQTQDFYIADNIIDTCKDGNGISVRSSGVVENNEISNTGKSGITYYDDHLKGPSSTLVIKNNKIRNAGLRFNRGAIDIISKKTGYRTVDHFLIENNNISHHKIGIDKKLKKANKTIELKNNFKSDAN